MKFGVNCVSGSRGLTECSRQSAGGGDKDRGISPQRRMISPNGLGGLVDADMGYQSSKYREKLSSGWVDMAPKMAKLRHKGG